MMTWIDELQLQYPTLFTNCYCGFDCEEGWKDLLIEAFEQLKKYDYLEIHQIKEKFGTLRLYTGPVKEEDQTIYSIINKAECKSAITCEFCGAPGSIRGDGWIKTRCNACEEKHIEEMKQLREEQRRKCEDL